MTIVAARASSAESVNTTTAASERALTNAALPTADGLDHSEAREFVTRHARASTLSADRAKHAAPVCSRANERSPELGLRPLSAGGRDAGGPEMGLTVEWLSL